ncbi:MAG: GHKL domain-containing protein, partial [Clostridiales bacterium]|nr:GHKL domain-containing protein [Candidatus Coliplasma equi]
IYVKCNKQSIKQLIGILLDNAIKYSNDNGKIIFSLKRDQDKAVMSVFNTGDPIPKEEIPYLFDRFYRVDESRSRDKGGNGLGLSIAKKIIENNEGSISVISNEENGTTFFCTFKLSKKSKKQKESETMQFN